MNSINTMNLQWFVIQTKPGNEHRVETHLFNQKIEAFLPLFETYQGSGEKMIRRIKPLFPNYLFARLDLNHHYDRVKWTRGVNRILGAGNEPVPISEKIIHTIKDRMGKNHFVTLDEDWQEGDLVRINSGPLKDWMGVFEKKISDRGRVRILLNLIGVDVPVQISQWQLRKVA